MATEVRLPEYNQVEAVKQAVTGSGDNALARFGDVKGLATAADLAAAKAVIDTLATASNLAEVKSVVDSIVGTTGGTGDDALAKFGDVKGLATSANVSAVKAVVDTLATSTNLAAVKSVVDSIVATTGGTGDNALAKFGDVKGLATSADLAVAKAVIDTLATSNEIASVKTVVDTLATASQAAQIKAVVDTLATATSLAEVKSAVSELATSSQAAQIKAVVDTLATATNLAAVKSVVDSLATSSQATQIKAVVDTLATATDLVAVKSSVDELALNLAAMKSAVDSRGIGSSDLATKGNIDQAVAPVALAQSVAQMALNRIEMMLTKQSEGQAGFIYEPMRKDVSNKVSLYWKDPKALTAVTVDGTLVTKPWFDTVVVKKEGSAPSNPTDGTVVVTETVRNKYSTLSSAYVDTQSDPSGWVYRAFARDIDGNYAAVDSSVGVFKSYVKYAFVIDEANSVENPGTGTACVTYAEDNKNYDYLYVDFAKTAEDGDDPDVAAPTGSCHWGDWQDAFFMPKPCMLNRDGTVAYYLDPDDLSKKADGTAADINDTGDTGANAMMEWPSIFVKVERSTALGTLTVYVSNVKLDEGYECFSTKYEHDGVVGYADHFYTAIFEGVVKSGRLRSVKTTGVGADALVGTVPSNGTNATTELSNARANDSEASNKYWATSVWADEDLIRLLTILVTKRLNTQATISANPATGSSVTAYNKVGTGYRKGMFYGHAGTSPVNSKCFGMENLWGHRNRRAQGLNMVDGKYYVNLYLRRAAGTVLNDFQTTDTAASYTGTYTDTGITIASSWGASYIKQVTGLQGLMFAPWVAGGSGAGDTTYYCDAAYNNLSGVRGFVSGGALNNGAYAGMFFSALSFAPSNTSWTYGASLSCKPF